MATPLINVRSPPQVIASLARQFDQPGALWSKMAKFMCAFSGSRALDLFVPGSCTDSSDFDFYVPANGHAIIGTIKALEAAGVRFASPFDWLSRWLDQGGTCSLPKWQAEALIEPFGNHWRMYLSTPPRTASLIDSLLDAVESNNIAQSAFTARCNHNNAVIVICPSKNVDYEHLLGMNPIRRTAKDGSTPVQLFYAPATMPTSHVLRFHSGAAQAFISPYGSTHLYFQRAQAKHSIE